ncbi:MAG: hypothetical protein M1834_001139 [Cirrosporium novae-zelandiae]|nr:MAG: hypothetical protein M1834_001139 [Cirrosporium novae-zelandiae]
MTVNISLNTLPQELILCVADFLPNSSLNALIQTQKFFARILTPHLYNDEIRFLAKPSFNPEAIDSYNLPFECLCCMDRWHSDIILDYFTTRPVDALTRTDEHGTTLLHRLVAGRANPELLEILLKKGVSIDAKNFLGNTPLFEAARQNNEEIMHLLLDAGADAMASDTSKITVLEVTALFCSTGMVQRVIDIINKTRKVTPNIDGDLFAPSTGSRVLRRAIFKGDESTVRLLLDNGAEVSSHDSYNTTALELAACRGHNSIVYLLLDRGADVLPFDDLGRSALTLAIEGNCDYSTIQRLIKAVQDSGGDISASSDASEDIAWNGFRPLHHAANTGQLPIVELLLKSGADVLARSERITALTCALAHYDVGAYENICRVLIEAINATHCHFDHFVPSENPLTGGTTLHAAAQFGAVCLVPLLISSGADILALDPAGRLALHVAILSGQEAIGKVLFQEMKALKYDFTIPVPSPEAGQSEHLFKLALDNNMKGLAQLFHE